MDKLLGLRSLRVAHFPVCAHCPKIATLTQEIFGMALLSAEGTGCYTDVFYERAEKLQSAWNVNLSHTLGAVMADEIGQLPLDQIPTRQRGSCVPGGKVRN